MELIHDHIINLGFGAFTQSEIREYLGGATDNGCRWIDGGISRDHADVFGPEGATKGKEFFVRQRLDRNRVIGNAVLTPGLVMQRQRY